MAIITSPYISGPDILEHPTRTVKEVRLDFSGVADGCIKAGSPINAAGKVANDATAIGILLHDNYSDCGCGHGMVVVAGRIKADVAEQHCGITISAEAKGGMPCVAFVDAAGVVTGGSGGGGKSEPVEVKIKFKDDGTVSRWYKSYAEIAELIASGEEVVLNVNGAGKLYKLELHSSRDLIFSRIDYNGTGFTYLVVRMSNRTPEGVAEDYAKLEAYTVGGSGGGSAALVFTENQQGELTANMSVEEACNSIRAGMSPMLIRQKSGETEIWCFAGGMLGDGWTSVNFSGTGGNTVSVMFDSGMDNPFIAE